MVVDELDAVGHDTQPPARFTEASLVKRLEELGVGRPSTYASIISTILDRGYVWKKGSALVPTFTAFAVVTLLEEHFPNLVDFAFTARMEDDLDGIASGAEEMEPWLSRFYFGVRDQVSGDGELPEGAAGRSGLGLKELVEERLGEIDARAVNSIPLGADPDGVPIVARVGRYGPYLERGDGDDRQTASIPEDLPPDELTVERAVELLEAPSGRPGPRAAPRQRPGGPPQGRAVRALRAGGGPRRRDGLQAPDRLAVQEHGPGHGHPRRRAARCWRCRVRWGSTPPTAR